jgi:hypothetical protein
MEFTHSHTLLRASFENIITLICLDAHLFPTKLPLSELTNSRYYTLQNVKLSCLVFLCVTSFTLHRQIFQIKVMYIDYFYINFKNMQNQINNSSFQCLQRCIQKFQDWPPGARTANGTALCH